MVHWESYDDPADGRRPLRAFRSFNEGVVYRWITKFAGQTLNVMAGITNAK
jgi:hypothetical protein